jgi:hypothetical protein
MVWDVKRTVHQVATLVVCCVGIVLSGHAAPGPTKTLGMHTPRAQLDLSLPATRDVEDHPHFLSLGGPRSGREQPSFNLAVGQDRVVGRVQTLVERFHREGLPVARLWENHSALISLGLNSRGKPGIWLVQKTH